MDLKTYLKDVVYKDMDKRGMFPATWTCLRCRKPLNADGGHPAELYAGTYNGLCYPCTSAPAFVKRVMALDNAQWCSHPPLCPSYRRDRPDYVGYADCEACKGTGVAKTSYSAWTHSSHYEYCSACSDRYHRHPLRERIARYSEHSYRAAEAVWQSELRRIAKAQLGKRPKQKAIKARTSELARSPRLEGIRRELLARCARLRTKINALNTAYGIDAVVDAHPTLPQAA